MVILNFFGQHTYFVPVSKYITYTCGLGETLPGVGGEGGPGGDRLLLWLLGDDDIPLRLSLLLLLLALFGLE